MGDPYAQEKITRTPTPRPADDHGCSRRGLAGVSLFFGGMYLCYVYNICRFWVVKGILYDANKTRTKQGSYLLCLFLCLDTKTYYIICCTFFGGVVNLYFLGFVYSFGHFCHLCLCTLVPLILFLLYFFYVSGRHLCSMALCSLQIYKINTIKIEKLYTLYTNGGRNLAVMCPQPA